MALCTNKDCKVETEGVCVEGRTLPQCPFYKKSDTQTAILASDGASTPPNASPSSTPKEDMVSLSSGQCLSATECSNFLKSERAIVVAVIGHSNVGKSTLMAGIYDMFHQGARDPYKFSGSKTMYAFEDLCHYVRSSCRCTVPLAPHTPRKDTARFYHLSLATTRTGNLNFLFSDRAGEEYEEASNRAENCKKLFEVARADVILVLADAAELGDVAKRHTARRKALGILRAIKDAQLVDTQSKIGIIMTRFDLALEAGAGDLANKEHARLVKDAKEVFLAPFIVEGFSVCASPKNKTLIEPGTGLVELLNFMSVPNNTRSSFPVEDIPLTRSFHQIVDSNE